MAPVMRAARVMLACALVAAGTVVHARDLEADLLLAVGDERFGAVATAVGGYAAGAAGVAVSRSPFEGAFSQAILMHGGGPDLLAARAGDVAPGDGSPGVLAALGAVTVGARGAAVFRADVASGALEFSGIFEVAPDGTTRRLVADGDPTPLGDGTFFAAVDLPEANAAGMVAFRADDTVGRQGLYAVEDGVVRRLIVAGESEPPVGAFETFGRPRLGADGTVVFFGRALSGKRGLFRRAPNGTISEVAAQGDPGPGGTFTSVDVPAIGPDGTVAFRGVSGGVRGIFVVRPEGLVRLAAEGEPAPGGGTYVSVGAPAVGEAGVVAFRAELTEPAEGVIAVLDAPALVAAAGDTTPLGPLCSAGAGATCFGDPAFASRGRLVFRAVIGDAALTRALFRKTLAPTARPAEVLVDCDAGQRVADGLASVADGGTVRVRGACDERVLVEDAGGVTVMGESVGRRKRRRPATLAPAAGTGPVLEVLAVAGPTVLRGLTVAGGDPAVRVAGAGHVLADLTLERGDVVLGGSGQVLDGLTMLRGDGPCVTIAASASEVRNARIRRCGGDGIVVAGDVVSLAGNVVVRSRGRGIVVDGVGNALVMNRVSRNRQGGLLVNGVGNTLRANRAIANRRGGIVAAPCNVDAGRNRARRTRRGPNLRLPACPSGAPLALATPGSLS